MRNCVFYKVVESSALTRWRSSSDTWLKVDQPCPKQSRRDATHDLGRERLKPSRCPSKSVASTTEAEPHHNLASCRNVTLRLEVPETIPCPCQISFSRFRRKITDNLHHRVVSNDLEDDLHHIITSCRRDTAMVWSRIRAHALLSRDRARVLSSTCETRRSMICPRKQEDDRKPNGSLELRDGTHDHDQRTRGGYRFLVPNRDSSAPTGLRVHNCTARFWDRVVCPSVLARYLGAASVSPKWATWSSLPAFTYAQLSV